MASKRSFLSALSAASVRVSEHYAHTNVPDLYTPRGRTVFSGALSREGQASASPNRAVPELKECTWSGSLVISEDKCFTLVLECHGIRSWEEQLELGDMQWLQPFVERHKVVCVHTGKVVVAEANHPLSMNEAPEEKSEASQGSLLLRLQTERVDVSFDCKMDDHPSPTIRLDACISLLLNPENRRLADAYCSFRSYWDHCDEPLHIPVELSDSQLSGFTSDLRIDLPPGVEAPSLDQPLPSLTFAAGTLDCVLYRPTWICQGSAKMLVNLLWGVQGTNDYIGLPIRLNWHVAPPPHWTASICISS